MPFEYFQGVFRVLRYDNLKAAVKKILRGFRREETARFIAFCSHWRFESEFCTQRLEVTQVRAVLARRCSARCAQCAATAGKCSTLHCWRMLAASRLAVQRRRIAPPWAFLHQLRIVILPHLGSEVWKAIRPHKSGSKLDPKFPTARRVVRNVMQGSGNVLLAMRL
jgi:hypothetical protein